MRRMARLFAAAVLAAPLTALVLPACVIKIGQGGVGGDDPSNLGGAAGEAGTAGAGSFGGGGGAGPSPDEIQQGEETYAQLDHVELASASARAGHMTCALSGAVDTGIQAQGLDPENLDVDALIALLNEYAPDAVQQANAWLDGVDPSALAYTVIPKPECVDQGCEYSPKCQQGHIPDVSHRCYVDDCGPAKCRSCPDWVNNILQNIAFKTWCSYVCVQTATSPPKVVAVGAGFISKLLGIYVGPICAPYP
jgi:hypothetical protein